MKKILNRKTLICILIAWMITNGWAYLALGIGILFDIRVLTSVASGYLALLWLPFTPEKIVTVAIASRLRHLIG